MPFDFSYQWMLTAHVSTILVTLLFVVIADVFGLLWWRGRIKILAKKYMSALHALVAAGLVISILTGAMMASTAWPFLMTQPAFILKIAFVAILVINAFVIHHHLKIATHTSYDELSCAKQKTLMVSGAVSTLAWIAVLLASQFFAL